MLQSSRLHLEDFVPAGAEVTDLTIDETGTATIDYREGSTRTLVSYFIDGKVSKTTRNHEHNVILGNFNNESYEVVELDN